MKRLVAAVLVMFGGLAVAQASVGGGHANPRGNAHGRTPASNPRTGMTTSPEGGTPDRNAGIPTSTSGSDRDNAREGQARPMSFFKVPKGDPLTGSTMDSPGGNATPYMAGSAGQQMPAK